MEHAIRNDIVAGKLSDMAGLLKALSEHADEVARIAPYTWARIESKLPWFPEIGPGAVRVLDAAASDCEAGKLSTDEVAYRDEADQ